MGTVSFFFQRNAFTVILWLGECNPNFKIGCTRAGTSVPDEKSLLQAGSEYRHSFEGGGWWQWHHPNCCCQNGDSAEWLSHSASLPFLWPGKVLMFCWCLGDVNCNIPTMLQKPREQKFPPPHCPCGLVPGSLIRGRKGEAWLTAKWALESDTTQCRLPWRQGRRPGSSKHDSRQEALVEDVSLRGSGDALSWMEIPFQWTVTPRSGWYWLNLVSIDWNLRISRGKQQLLHFQTRSNCSEEHPD